MTEIKTKEADWKVSENRQYVYVGRLGTSKGFAYVKYDGENFIKITVSLKIIVNGVDLGKYADLEATGIQDMELAHAWVESLLM